MNIIEVFDSKWKIEANSYNNINVCYIGYITIKGISDYNSISSVNSLYDPLHYWWSTRIRWRKHENKYLTFAAGDENKKVSRKYKDLWDGIKSLIDKIYDKPGEYGKDFMKI